MKWLGFAVAVIVAAVVLFKATYPTYTYRYRMTVNVEVDGQLRSGSSVIEVRVSKQPRFLADIPPLEYGVTGEAVYVDLGEHRSVLALLASGASGQDVDFLWRIVPSHFKLNLFEDRSLAQLPTLHGRWELAQDEFPTFISFEQPDDPKSARRVSENEAVQISGQRIRLRGVTIEITDDQVTRGIENRLGWWTISGRPAVTALQAAGLRTAASIDAEFAFRRN